MTYFPQLAQFPIRKRRVTRTVINECADGRRIRLADTGAAVVEWRIEFAGLTDQELDTLQQFFRTSEGRLGTFTFVDPTDNLLAWSEKLDEPVWEKSPFLQVNGLRLTNTGGAAASLQQTINIPAWFYYCFSLSARSDDSTSLTLLRDGDGTARQIGPEWRRLLLSTKVTTTAESARFGIEIEAGKSVEVSGLQVEAQAGPSAYKKTLAKAGIYGKARFQEDTLEFTTQGPNQHSCLVKVVGT
jgi:hypothetical protein